MPSQIGLKAHRSVRRNLIAGVASCAVLVVGVGGFAATTEMAGAVIAPGLLVVDSNVKKVQHPTGGVVAELRVRDGSRVKAGDIVARLDETVTQANLAIVIKSLNENYVRQARLEAERDGLAKIIFPPEIIARLNDPDVARVVKGEQRLFETRLTSRQGQQSQLRERVGQLQEQIQGTLEQIESKKREIEFIKTELEGVRTLWRQNLVPIQRVTVLERDAVRLSGERGALISTVAQIKGKITETELQIMQIDQDLRTEVGKELAEIRGKTSELVERKIAAEDQLKRIDLRAPQDGVVHQLSIHTVGGVITPGEPVMLIVPVADDLQVEAKINPQDIDQLRYGQNAVLRFSAFNQRTTPEINGQLTRISSDITQDQKTGAAYYTIRVSVPEAELARLGNVKLIPGMPVETYVQTGQRTIMSYLTKPLTDQMNRAFREK